MSFRIQPNQPSADEARRIAAERLGKAIDSLEEGSARGIHDARKRLKETRALLRLLRQPLGKRCFKALNASLRDAGQALSGLRDATAMIECWDALSCQSPQRFAEADFKAVRQRLVARAEAGNAGPEHHEELIASLRQVIGEIDDWSLRPTGFALFAKGIRRSYRDGRRALAEARSNPSDECLHEWRKRVKDHWYQTRLLQQAWPKPFKARKKVLEQLAEYLGDDHDLAMLQALMAEQPELFGREEIRATIARATEQRRELLQAYAFDSGARVYAEAPKALVRRWRAYWRVARHAD